MCWTQKLEIWPDKNGEHVAELKVNPSLLIPTLSISFSKLSY
jgi:hypothetical protein